MNTWKSSHAPLGSDGRKPISLMASGLARPMSAVSTSARVPARRDMSSMSAYFTIVLRSRRASSRSFY